VLCITAERCDRYPDTRRQLAERLMFAHSVGAALQNAMLAAHAAGLASCWMCAPLFCPEAVVTCLELPPALQPQALLTLGYAAEPPAPRGPVEPRALVALWA
jgi:coenzyme F420-0:L-glutamate ligase/coenzyme F420-1:gamma-L-glutamate ligase